jgi:hypothetical protein
MQCFNRISAQGGELVAVIGPLPNKYFIFYLYHQRAEFVVARRATVRAAAIAQARDAVPINRRARD